jgi:hypothetical protein
VRGRSSCRGCCLEGRGCPARDSTDANEEIPGGLFSHASRTRSGQPINFNAIDIQHVDAAARITEDWHREDNLTFLQQTGLVTNTRST